jgi:drug/metabolite transporter (DMT)-like permease
MTPCQLFSHNSTARKFESCCTSFRNFEENLATKCSLSIPAYSAYYFVSESLSPHMPKSASHKNYRIGSMYSVITAFLLATQEPFSALAAKRLSPMNFVCVTQCALLLSIPLLILPAASRRDFFALIFDFSNLAKLSLLFLIGLCGLLLYDLGLSNAHPIIIAAILNLSPFWAALIGLLISKKPIPVSPVIFFGCLAVAFIGAMTIAWSQTDNSNRLSISDLANNILHSSWVYAIPIPIFFALSGTLIGQWFKKFDDSAHCSRQFYDFSFTSNTGRVL